MVDNPMRELVPGTNVNARPSITATRPGNGDVAVPRDAFVAADIKLPTPGAGIDASTLNSSTVKLYRANVDSGELHFVRDLMPADTAGVDRVIDVVVTSDDRAYAYGVVRNLSTLFLSTGWRRKLE